ncbi:sarcosine oxidase subunit beta family protein [Methylobacterium ajmalii]|jgi:sarcosine oxidase subunit beta|uniref:sarcosine oxidase subunit beta family protein n=1 Tax=Methylobacterium ajmalii TaxID=2738439 RepID=UPI00190D87C7|nr:sarcosine oxidase subunit beta family protein [Methylobacterium ajmalii]MBK3400877.1 sarcosine oxidase subunit beta family protein [Methylobacterium ajmalii]MBK3410952.1 sarcosine oxidase subunit beta family protein [Methylobacterium ajmalii]MBK3420585.1 sarcosine oxidase subunit beta family protein [Methylobacterium ajmalii]MBZ6415720.1 sarcosine oxidase subunit beta family protein [Methylobacterium sp.]
MSHFSLPALLAKAFTGNKSWQPQWPDAEPKAEYDVVVVGAGGHGLGTAYYLAKEHGITNVAVIDKGWLGGGNTGRNTTIIRSNYLYDESARLYEHAMKLWEGLSQELNYNVMFSQRGVMMLAHNVHDEQSFRRHIHANRLNGIDNEWLTAQQAKAFCPALNIAPDARFPVVGAALQRRGGVARHDAVAWGYARGAAARGVDIVQNCPVIGIRRDASGRISGVETARGFIRAKKVAVSAAGSTSVVMGTADVRLPLESYPLQALVSEPVKPAFPCVVMSNTVHAYMSQSDKGELVIGSGTDQYVSYSQRGGLPLIEHTLAAICEVFPIFTRMRMLRKWGGIVDVTPDRSPIVAKTPVPGLYVNCGWGTGGFKATPGAANVFAHTVARDEPHPINAPFTIERFTTGRLIDEAAAAAVAH